MARAVWLLLMLLAVSAGAQEPDRREQARRLADEGADFYDRGDYPAALDKLRQAEALMPVPTIGLHVARALVALGRLRDAAEQYQRTIDLPIDETLAPELVAVQTEARETARAERVAMLASMPKLAIRATGARPDSLTLDGDPLDPARLPMIVPVDPREHVVVARLGTRRFQETVRLGSAEQKAVVIDLAAPPSPTPPAPPPRAPERDAATDPLLPVGWVAIGVGSALVATSLVSYGVAAAKASELEDRCPDHVCRQSQAGDVREDIEGYDALRSASMVTGIAGGALLAGGMVMLLVVPAFSGEQRDAFVAPILGPSVGVHGRF